MKCRLRKFPLIHLLPLLFHSSFVKKKIFYSENTQYVYNLYGTNLYVNACRVVFRTQSKIYRGDSLRKSQKIFIADVILGSKYASGISFTVEKVYSVSLFV